VWLRVGAREGSSEAEIALDQAFVGCLESGDGEMSLEGRWGGACADGVFKNAFEEGVEVDGGVVRGVQVEEW